MHAMEFLRSAGTATSRPMYVLFGDDSYLRRESSNAIVRAALGGGSDVDELAVSRFPEAAPLSDVLDELRTLPFLAKKRVAIVENADAFVTAHRRELETYAEKPCSTGVFILSVKSWPSNTKLAKLVEKIGVPIDCKTPVERELPAWLSSLAKDSFGAKLDPDAARLLLELVGPEVGLLVSEVEKLATYVGSKARITHDDVAKMVDAGRVQEIWAAIDRATTGRGDEALAILDGLLGSGEHPIKLLAAVSYSLQKVHHAGQLRRSRMDGRDACKAAGIYPNQVEKTLAQHSHLGPSRVNHLPALLLKADLDLKGNSQLDPRAVLERLFVDLSAPRRD